jgi:hypothetical protein
VTTSNSLSWKNVSWKINKKGDSCVKSGGRFFKEQERVRTKHIHGTARRPL